MNFFCNFHPVSSIDNIFVFAPEREATQKNLPGCLGSSVAYRDIETISIRAEVFPTGTDIQVKGFSIAFDPNDHDTDDDYLFIYRFTEETLQKKVKIQHDTVFHQLLKYKCHASLTVFLQDNSFIGVTLTPNLIPNLRCFYC